MRDDTIDDAVMLATLPVAAIGMGLVALSKWDVLEPPVTTVLQWSAVSGFVLLGAATVASIIRTIMRAGRSEPTAPQGAADGPDTARSRRA